MFFASGVSILFEANYHSTAEIIVNQGGTSSGKTYAILQVLMLFAVEQPGKVITVVGQDVPNLKSGALRDALKITDESETLKNAILSYNKSERVFQFHNGSIIEFRSYADPQDAKSGKRDFLFINEANGISWDIYQELSLRTKTRVFIDYNPNAEFWVHDRLLGKKNVKLIISDHRHNPFLNFEMRQKIESIKNEDIELWKVYARGLTGKISGLVLNNWQLCDYIPPRAKLIAIGLDFGFTNDETGCLAVFKQNGELWIDELIYETGLTNPDISKQLNAIGLSKNALIVADSAEPKSIEELRRLGWNIVPAKKGADSINISIDILKRYKLNISRRSINLRRELARYKWKTDLAGRTLNEPIDQWNHLIDPLRYVALNQLKIKGTGKTKTRLPYIQQHLIPGEPYLFTI